MTEIYVPNLPKADPAIEAALAQSVVAPMVSSTSFAGWEAVLKDPAKHPLRFMRTQNQSYNDCQAQSLNNGEERRQHYVSGTITQRSDAASYAASEFIDRGRVGANQGSTIGSGVTLITQGIKKLSVAPGTVSEADWPYVRVTNTTAFIRDIQQARIISPAATEHQPPAAFREAMAANTAGGTHHIGIYWPSMSDKRYWRQTSTGYPELIRLLSSGEGHAVEQMWADVIDGEWKLFVWNSHGKGRHFYIGERIWNQLVSIKFAPFGGHLLLPDRAEERFLTANEIHKGTWS